MNKKDYIMILIAIFSIGAITLNHHMQSCPDGQYAYKNECVLGFYIPAGQYPKYNIKDSR